MRRGLALAISFYVSVCVPGVFSTAMADTSEKPIALSTGEGEQWVYHWGYEEPRSILFSPKTYLESATQGAWERARQGEVYRAKMNVEGPGFYFAGDPLSSRSYGNTLVRIKVKPNQAFGFDGPKWTGSLKDVNELRDFYAIGGAYNGRANWGVVRNPDFLDATKIKAISFADYPFNEDGAVSNQDYLFKSYRPAGEISSYEDIDKFLIENARYHQFISDWINDSNKIPLVSEHSILNEAGWKYIAKLLIETEWSQLSSLDADHKLPSVCHKENDEDFCRDNLEDLIDAHRFDESTMTPQDAVLILKALKMVPDNFSADNYDAVRSGLVAAIKNSPVAPVVQGIISDWAKIDRFLALNGAFSWGEKGIDCVPLKPAATAHVAPLVDKKHVDHSSVSLSEHHFPDDTVLQLLSTKDDRSLVVVSSGAEIGAAYVILKADTSPLCAAK